MAAARLGCKRTVVGTGWANSWPGCMSRLRKCYSHLSGGSFLAGKASRALSGCLAIESADHCMLVNEGAWLRSRVCLLRQRWKWSWAQSCLPQECGIACWAERWKVKQDGARVISAYAHIALACIIGSSRSRSGVSPWESGKNFNYIPRG